MFRSVSHVVQSFSVVLVASVVALSALGSSALAAELPMQGALRTVAGGPVADGDYILFVKLYDAFDAPKQVYAEALKNVSVVSGFFAVGIGAVPDEAIPDALLLAGSPLWVGIQVGGDPELERMPLRALPLAWHARQAGKLACSACVTGAMLADATVTDAKLAFTYAGSQSKGGPADEALHATTADEAKEAAHAEAADIAKEADHAAAADDAKHAGTADQATAADEALGLNCTGCVSPNALSAATKAGFVAASGGTVAGDLDVQGTLSAKTVKASDTSELGNASLATARFLALDISEAVCDAANRGQLAFDDKTGRMHLCDGKAFIRLAVCSDTCKPPATVPCGQPVPTGCGDLGACSGKGALCASGSMCTDTGCKAYGKDATVPGMSCKDILTKTVGANTGSYWLDPDGSGGAAAFETWCDMETDGGGWTRTVAMVAGDKSMCDTNKRWQPTLAMTEKWPEGGEVMTKYFTKAAVSPNAEPDSVLKFSPGPYKTIHAMFSFPKQTDGWTYSSSAAFSVKSLAGKPYGNGMWWDWGGALQRKANYCIGTSPNHQICVYEGTYHNQCGSLQNATTGWSASGAAHEIYVREP